MTFKFNGAQKCAFITGVLLRAQLVWSFFKDVKLSESEHIKMHRDVHCSGIPFVACQRFYPFCVFAAFLPVLPLFWPKVHWNFMPCSWDIQNYGDVHRVCGCRHQFFVGNSFCCVHTFSNHFGVFSPFLHPFALLTKLHCNFMPSSWDI